MAGKNQHYIPQFLQRGFSCQAAQGFALSSKEDKRKARVWTFERENANKRLVCKAGMDPYFYGPENSSVDTTITDAENLYGKLVNNLRRHRKDTAVEEESIPELLAHMFVRSKNMRQTLVDLGEVALDTLSKTLPNIEDMAEFLIKYLQENVDNLPDAQREIIRDSIQNNPDSIRHLIKDKKIMEEIVPELYDNISHARKNINEMAKNAHLDSLSESIEPQNRVRMFEGLHWFIMVKRAGSFILGDALVICQKATGEYGSILLADEDFQHVFLPISSQHLLIGTKEPTALDPDPEDINQASARMSNEFFIASQNTKQEILYQKKLGDCYTEFLTKQTVEMTGIADQFWTNGTL
jgi:hypothetical protein